MGAGELERGAGRWQGGAGAERTCSVTRESSHSAASDMLSSATRLLNSASCSGVESQARICAAIEVSCCCSLARRWASEGRFCDIGGVGRPRNPATSPPTPPRAPGGGRRVHANCLMLSVGLDGEYLEPFCKAGRERGFPS